MPAYFAYGANMDMVAMARRCPASKCLGPGRLMNHRVVIMAEGFASVRPAAGSVVHGIVWDLALADVPALDRFEDVAGGLYSKTFRPVIKPVGSVRALLYIGRPTEGGTPQVGYLESVMDAAQSAGLPTRYLKTLADLRGTKRPTNGVRPRFATPFDRT